MCLTAVHSPVAIGNFDMLLEDILMVAHKVSENKIDNIMVVKEYIIFHAINPRQSAILNIEF